MPSLAPLIAPLIKDITQAIRVSPIKEDLSILPQLFFGIRKKLDKIVPEIPKILDSATMMWRDENQKVVKGLQTLAKNTGIGKTNPAQYKVMQALEGHIDPKLLKPNERVLHDWWVIKNDKAAIDLGLPPGMRIKHHIAHLVDPMNIPQVERVLYNQSHIGTLSEADYIRYHAIQNLAQKRNIPIGTAFDLYKSGYTAPKGGLASPINEIPKSIYNQFVQIRRGFPVYNMNFYEMAENYLKAANRKIYMEPALYQVQALAEKALAERPLLKRELVSRIREHILHQPSYTSKLINQSLAPFDTFVRTISKGKVEVSPRAIDQTLNHIYRGLALWDIGGNISPIKKHFVADMLSIYSELGEWATAQGFTHTIGLSKSAKELRQMASTIGNVRERFPSLEVFESYSGKTMRGIQKAAFFAYQKIDLMNQYTAWIGGYKKALRLGPKLKHVEASLAKGYDLRQSAVLYANEVNQIAVPKQTALDLPGLLGSPLRRLMFQFSAKRMQRGEMIFNQIKRAGAKDWGPIGRTIVSTAILSGFPGDEWLAKKTGIDPNRLPFYDVMGKLGFGMRKVAYGIFPGLGPVLQVGADISRFGHDPERLVNRVLGGLGSSASTGEELHTGLPAVPLGIRSGIQAYHELKSGQRRSSIGGLVREVTPKDVISKWLGFDISKEDKAIQEFAKHNFDFHQAISEIHALLSQSYYRNVIQNQDWSAFYADMYKIQQKYPEILISPNMIKGAILNDELPARTRLERHLPRSLRFQLMQGHSK